MNLACAKRRDFGMGDSCCSCSWLNCWTKEGSDEKDAKKENFDEDNATQEALIMGEEEPSNSIYNNTKFAKKYKRNRC